MGGVRALALAAATAACAVFAPAASAAWDAPFDLSPTRANFIEPSVGIDAAGNGIALYSWDGPPRSAGRAQAAFRTRSGRLRRQTLSQAPFGRFDPDSDLRQVEDAEVAVNGAGEAVAAWVSWENFPGSTTDPDPGDSVLQVAIRPPGGRFGDTANLSAVTPDIVVNSEEAAASVGSPRIGIDAEGNALVAWVRTSGEEVLVEAAFRPAGGSFGPAEVVSRDGGELSFAMNSAGEAVLAWATQRNQGPLAYSLRAPGGGFGAPEVIEGTQVINSDLDVAIGTSGLVGLAWRSPGPLIDQESIQTRFRPRGEPLQNPRSGVIVAGYGPDIGIDGSDNVVMLNVFNERVLAWRAPLASPNWGESQAISRRRRIAVEPDLVLEDGGRMAAVWPSYRRRSVWIEGARGRNGRFGRSAQLAAPGGGDGVDPWVDAAMNSSGRVFAAWERNLGNGNSVEGGANPRR